MDLKFLYLINIKGWKTYKEFPEISEHVRRFDYISPYNNYRLEDKWTFYVPPHYKLSNSHNFAFKHLVKTYYLFKEVIE